MNCILNCDDFGMHPTINDGILSLLELGASASLFPTGNFFEEAVASCLEKGKKQMGVHLALNGEYKKLPTRPVSKTSQVTSLVDRSGYLYNDISQLKDRANIDEVSLELENQILKVLQKGIEITHLDGHCFFYEPEESSMAFYEVANKLSKKYKIPMRRYYALSETGVRSYMIWDGYDTMEDRLGYYERFFETPREVCELIIHPAKDRSALLTFTQAADKRLSDFQFFSGALFREWLSKKQVKLIQWPELSNYKSPVPKSPLPDIKPSEHHIA